MSNVKAKKSRNDRSDTPKKPLLINVYFGVFYFVKEIANYMAAVKAIGEIEEDTTEEACANNLYLILSEEAIWR